MSEPLRFPLDPKIDVAFKALLGREETKDLLVSFLNGVLDPESPIEEVEILNPYTDLDGLGGKVTILDLRVRDRAGKRYAVEMQCRNHRALRERILFNTARLLAEQLGRGDAYWQLEPVIMIVIADFVMFEDLSGYHSTYELWAEKARVKFSSFLRIDVLELPKYGKRPGEATTLEEKWVSFIKEADKVTREVLERWGTPELVRAKEELERLCADENLRRQYADRIDALRLYVTEIEGSFEDGFEKGIEQGIEKGVHKVVGQLLRRGLPVGEIADLTGLPPETIEKVRVEE